MTIPSVAFSFVCAWLIGALFHMLVDGGGARLALYLGLSTLGFAAGHLVSTKQGWSFLLSGRCNWGSPFSAVSCSSRGSLAYPNPNR